MRDSETKRDDDDRSDNARFVNEAFLLACVFPWDLVISKCLLNWT